MLNKIVSNEHLDEMQVQTRNKIGHQSFIMLYFLLMIDLLLRDHGFMWASSSMSVLVIMLLCLGYYGTRIAWAGAYVGPLTKSRKRVYFICLLVAMTTIIAIIKKTNFFNESLNISDGGFLRLFIFFFVFIMIIVVSTIISRRKNNVGND